MLAAPSALPTTLDLTLADQLVRAALPGLISSVVGALASDPSFTVAITAEVRRTTFRVAEAVLFEDDVHLPPSLCVTLEAAVEGAPEQMETATEPEVKAEHGEDGAAKEDLIRLQ